MKEGSAASLQSIIAAEDGKGIVTEFKNIILSAYGKRSDDGKRFIKNQTLREEFESTEAYSTLFIELVTDTEAAISFVNGVIPQDMSAETAKLTTSPLTVVPEPTLVTKSEVEAMSQEELIRLGARISSGEVKLGDS